MSRQRFTALIIAILAIFPVFGRTVAEIFASANNTIVPLLSYNTRLDMLDYYRAGSDRPSKTIFEGEARITSLSDNFLSFTDSKKTSTQMGLFTSRNDTIVGVITTVATPTEDSRLDFYYINKQPSKFPPASTPTYSDWLTKEGKQKINQISQILPFIMQKAVFDETTSTLTFVNNAKEQLIAEEYDKISEYLIPSITYDIEGIKFKLRK